MTVKTQKELENAWKKINTKPIIDNLFYLADRWADEHKYEDINDYQKAVEKYISKDLPKAKVVKMLKRPFGFQIQIDNGILEVKLYMSGKVSGRFV